MLFRTSPVFLFLIAFLPLSIAHADVEVIGGWYRADREFPEYMHIWQEGFADRDDTVERYAYDGMPLGGSIHVFLVNNGAEGILLDDLLYEGVPISKIVVRAGKIRKNKIQPASIHLSSLSEREKQRIVSLGEPIWWKANPKNVLPGECAEIVVRLRTTPNADAIRIGIKDGDSVRDFSVSIRPENPRIESISFSTDLKNAYVYVTHPGGGAKIPERVLVDSKRVPDVQILSDKDCDTTLAVLTFPEPVLESSFHVFEAEYSDGTRAWAGIRAWGDEFAYGIWGSRPGKENEVDLARRYVNEIHEHNINVQMEMVGSAAVREFLKTDEGLELFKTLGIKRMVSDPWKGRTTDPYAYFLKDEPDAHDYSIKELELRQRIGGFAQSLVDLGYKFRDKDPLSPQLVNVDSTFKPHNWYIYGQLTDIFAIDPYYQSRLTTSFNKHPDRLPLFTKATILQGICRIARFSSAPMPLHIILNSVEHRGEGGVQRFRFGTPEEKRIEAYYALGAGAKAYSYWWYTPSGKCNGCGDRSPAGSALWREIGLLGAELRTAGRLIVKSCPARLDVESSEHLSVVPLLAGSDSLILVCVNENYTNDRMGTVYKPIENAWLEIDLPKWLKPKEALEISYDGVNSLGFADDDPAGSARMELGKVELTRLIVITADPELRTALANEYEERFKNNVGLLIAE